MSYVLNICENYSDMLADDVRRAIGFTPTLKIVGAPIGDVVFTEEYVAKHIDAPLAKIRDEGQWPVVWAYPSSGDIAAGKITLGSPKMMADAGRLGVALRKHEQAGGKKAGVSILSEPGDDWHVTPAKYVETFEQISSVIPDGWARIWAPTAMKGLSNAIAYLPPSATMMGVHSYGIKTWQPGSAPNGRLLALSALADVLGLPLCVPECGITDVEDIAASGTDAWFLYYKRVLAWAAEHEAIFVALLSQNWHFGIWKDGRWAPTLSVEDGMLKYPKAQPTTFGFPGCPEAVKLLRKKLASADVVKLAADPFALS